MFIFFDNLVSVCLDCGFFSLAKTQQLMNDLLVSYLDLSEEAGLLREFLIFDWLLSGHRFLPEIFNTDINGYRDILWHQAAESVPGLYTAKERNHFFKRGIFFPFSADTLLHCPLPPGQPYSYIGFFKNHDQQKTTVVVIPCK